MTRKYAKHDEATKEEREVGRLVRKAPEKKPPRDDRARRRVKVDDADLGGRDKDLSMNYKDIGGSVKTLARKVARRYVEAIVFPTQEALDAYLEQHPNADPANHSVADPGQGGANPSPNPPSRPGRAPRPAPPPATPRTTATEQEMREMDMEDLEALALNGDLDAQEIARDVIKQRKSPLPREFPPVGNFTGQLDPGDVAALQEHITNWDLMDYSQNLRDLSESKMMAEVAGNARDAAYFDAVRKVYEDAAGGLRVQNLRALGGDVDALLGEDVSDSAAFSDADRAQLARRKRDWAQSAMFSSLRDVEKAHAAVAEELDGAGDDDSERATYLRELKGVLEGAMAKKMFNKNVAADRVLETIRDAAEDGSPLKNLDPGEVDFTNPKEVDRFVDSLRVLPNKDLIEMVKGEPSYLMLLGVSGEDKADAAVLGDKQRNAFFEAFREDLSARGFYEKVKFYDADSPMDLRALEEYRDNLQRHVDREERKQPQKSTSFWDVFISWMDNMTAPQNSKKSSHRGAEARAFRLGFSSACAKAGLNPRAAKVAQYRGLPGPLDPLDPQAPERPHWRLPASSQSLTRADAAAIVAEALRWLEDSLLTHAVVDYDFDLACRLALDYAIHTAEGFKYSGAVPAPFYEQLLAVLKAAAPARR